MLFRSLGNLNRLYQMFPYKNWAHRDEVRTELRQKNIWPPHSEARPMTQLVLSGGDFSHCGRAAAARAKRKGPARQLWGRDKGGHFSTIGRSASATVRGTRWLTADTCAGTRVTVSQGAVTVRPRHGGRAVTVRAGHSHLVRARKAS